MLKKQSDTVKCLRVCIILSMTIVIDAFAIDRYVDDTGTDSGNCTNPSSECQTLGYAIQQMNGSDTLIVRDGLYEQPNDAIVTAPSGTASGYTIIKAENDGGAVINAKLSLKDPVHHIQLEGIKWKGSNNDVITGNNIKIFRCAFEGGPAGGNTHNFNIGTNDDDRKARNILIEDSWFYGLGGRYTLLIIWASEVVIRRTTIRHDGGWDTAGLITPGSTPESGITIYNSENVQLQNVIVLDSITTSFQDAEMLRPRNFTAAFYNVSNEPDRYRNTRIVGSISFNNIRTAFGYDDGSNKVNAIIENSAAWRADNAEGYFAGSALTISNKDQVEARNLTLINSQKSGTSNTTAVANWGENATGFLTIKNSIITNAPKGFKGSSESYNVCDLISQQDCNTTNSYSYIPQSNGLLYLTRIEDGSNLEVDGENGSTIGATIINRIGQSGTLYGEPNFDTLLNEPLWPWTNQARMVADFCSANGIQDRGLCISGKSFTAYIWEALGSSCPEGICSGSGLIFEDNFESL